jgi:predicted dehydrogenase
MAGGLVFGLPSLAIGSQRPSRVAGPNAEIGVAVVGLGGIDTVGGVGGRGRQLISRLREVLGVRIVALCDVDKAILDHGVQQFKDRREDVAAYADVRKVLDDKAVDAVAIATPNHWHALGTIWACRADKDVYVEKPFSYNIWEGLQMVAAARKHGRMVQVGTQRRSSEVLRQALEYLRSGQLGPIRCAHAIVYRAREGIGKVSAPTPVPSTVDYDLWCGPAPRTPLMRKQLHYEWHWLWATGNGEIGNNGAHMIDVGRWALGQNKPAPRAMSIGGRLGFNDGGETPNTQIAILDYQPAPLICEIRNFRATKGVDSLGKFRGTARGIVIECEGGYIVGDSSGTAAFDNADRQIKEFKDDGKPREIETSHLANFVAAVRSRNADDLRAEALEGHVSAAGSHMANVSHRLGKQSPPEAILQTIRGNRELSDAFERCREYLRQNGVDLGNTKAVVGPWVTFDSSQERFVGEFADRANELSQRDYREPFVVPKVS